MKVTAAVSRKRKAVESDIEEDLADVLNDMSSDERIKNLEDGLADLKNTVHDLKKTVDDLKKTIVEMSKTSKVSDDDEEEEELSDDEESVVDESDPWTVMFLQLREYKILHGDCKVPEKFKENLKLGRWVKNQKQIYTDVKTGKKGKKITPERINKLDSIGFYWGKKFPSPPTWDEMFEKLKDYQQKMGNCNVPFNATHPNALAKWTAYQRAEYKRFKKGRDSLLTLDQIAQLKGIGFKWKGPKL